MIQLKFTIYPSEESYLYDNLDIPIPIKFEKMIFDNDDNLVGIKNKIIYSQKNAFYPMIQQVGLNSLMLGLDQEIIIGSDLGLKSTTAKYGDFIFHTKCTGIIKIYSFESPSRWEIGWS